MGNGYQGQPTDALDQLRMILQDVRRRLSELEALDGSQIYNTVQELRRLVDGLIEQTEVNVSGNVTAGGTVTGTAGITSTGVYALDVTTLPGGRAATWVHVTGRLGQTVSSITKKTDLTPAPYKASQFLACAPFLYHYTAQLDIRDNPDNPNFDPAYVVPWDVGFIAEYLIDNGLGDFVFFNEDGSPRGIHYAEFGSVFAAVVGRDHEARIVALEARSRT